MVNQTLSGSKKSSQKYSSQSMAFPVIVVGIILAVVASVIEWLTLWVGHQSFQPKHLVFWAIPIAFFELAIFKPRWRLACLFALIFWLPGPIDSIGKVPVSFYITADWMRAFSLLDLFLVLMLFLPKGFRLNRRLPRRDVIWALLTLAIAWTLFSAAVYFVRLEPERRYALLMVSMFVRFALVYKVIFRYFDDFSDLRRLYWGGVVGALGLLVNTWYSNITYSGADRLTVGTFGNNNFSALLAILILLMFILIMVKRSWTIRLSLVGLSLICMIGILLSGARVGFLMILVGLTIIIIAYRGISPIRLLRMGVVMVLIVVGVWVLLQALPSNTFKGFGRFELLVKIGSGKASASELKEATATLDNRFVFWKESVRFLNDSPWIGVGAGQYNYERSFSPVNIVAAPNGDRISLSDPHNGFVFVAVENGYPVIVLYILVIWIILSKGWKAVTKGGRAMMRNLLPKADFMRMIGWFAISCVLIMAQLTNSYLTHLYLQIFWALLLFVLLRMGYIISAKIRSEQPCEAYQS